VRKVKIVEPRISIKKEETSGCLENDLSLDSRFLDVMVQK